MSFSRRSFLKALGMAGASVAVGLRLPPISTAAGTERRLVASTLRRPPTTGQVIGVALNERDVLVSGSPSYPQSMVVSRFAAGERFHAGDTLTMGLDGKAYRFVPSKAKLRETQR